MMMMTISNNNSSTYMYRDTRVLIGCAGEPMGSVDIVT